MISRVAGSFWLTPRRGKPWKIQYDAGLLVTVIRDPDVLEAVDEALFGGVEAEAIYELGGGQERVMRAFAKPLAPGSWTARRWPCWSCATRPTPAAAERTCDADFLANAGRDTHTARLADGLHRDPARPRQRGRSTPARSSSRSWPSPGRAHGAG